jgi:hypothetical protein
MSLLFLNIATSGLLKDGEPAPWICRVAASMCDEDGTELDSLAVSVRAEGRFIDAGAAASHGITSRAAAKRCVHEVHALRIVCGMEPGPKRPDDYFGMVNCAGTLVAWDVNFVRAVVAAALADYAGPAVAWIRPGLTAISLRDTARTHCKLPDERPDSTGAYKMPTRDEAARILLGAEPRPLPHTADSNLHLERRIYFELRARGEFKEETE